MDPLDNAVGHEYMRYWTGLTQQDDDAIEMFNFNEQIDPALAYQEMQQRREERGLVDPRLNYEPLPLVTNGYDSHRQGCMEGFIRPRRVHIYPRLPLDVVNQEQQVIRAQTHRPNRQRYIEYIAPRSVYIGRSNITKRKIKRIRLNAHRQHAN